jgi:adenylate cyclase
MIEHRTQLGSRHMAEVGQTVSVEAVRDQMMRILSSPQLDASARNRKFLTFVVEETLAGRGGRIKGYTVATSVFGRDEHFDPQIDSIVRIEAGRLRRSLERYYLTAGRSDPVKIEIPRGSYVPSFMVHHGERDSVSPHGAPAVLVTPFEEEGDREAFPNFTRGFVRALIIALSRFTGLRVFCADRSLRHLPGSDPAETHRDADVEYVLSGGTSFAPDEFSIDVLLVEDRSGRTVWGESFTRALRPSGLIALRNEVANQVARTLAQPYGVIHSDLAQDFDGTPPEAMASYAAVLRFYTYWRTFDRTRLEEVHVGLERAVVAEPNYAEACACLSLLYSNAHRFSHPTGAVGLDPHERALTLARQAVDRAPSSSWALYALGLARWFAGDPSGGIAALEMGRNLNPNDTTILADLGQRYAMLGQWDKAVPLIEEAYARNPSQPGSYRIGLFLYHYAHGEHEEALAEARRVEAPQVLYGHVAVAAAAGRLGRHQEAAAALTAIRSIDPGYERRVVSDLESRNLAPDLIQAVVEGLTEAGLPVPASPVSTASHKARC